jgi:hypothetical protein
MTFAPGERVVVQEIWDDRVWAARPMVVARDADELTALWFPKGTLWKRPIPPLGSEPERDRGKRLARCLLAREWVFEDAAWDVSTLVLSRPQDWYAVWISWLDDGTQWGWYVNLQEPVRRTAAGFATMDLVLDVLVENDLTWRWKDEDELRTFVSLGVFDEPLADRLYVEGRRVAELAERIEPPFDGSWSGWRPDPSWPVPELSDDWDVP